MPVFDENRRHLERWIDWLDEGRVASVRRAIARVQSRLRRVTGSPRHLRLVEFLDFTSLALESGETQGARYLLITALASFGWCD